MIQYWFEFRRRAILCFLVYLSCFVLSLIFFDNLYSFLMRPLRVEDFGVLVSQGITEPFVLPFQVAQSMSWVFVIPFIIQQLLMFVFPALYDGERQILSMLASIVVVLFYVGAGFGFFFVIPMLLSYVHVWLPSGIMFLPTIGSYLTFCLDMACAFGVVFEVPVILMFCIIQGWLSIDMVRNSRRWWVVGIFFMAMIVTPPDVYSQLLLALPLWLMIELVLVIAVKLQPKMIDVVTSD